MQISLIGRSFIHILLLEPALMPVFSLERFDFYCPHRTFCYGAICRRQCQYALNTVFRKSCNVFCAKLKEVQPIKLNFCTTNKCFAITHV